MWSWYSSKWEHIHRNRFPQEFGIVQYYWDTTFVYHWKWPASVILIGLKFRPTPASALASPNFLWTILIFCNLAFLQLKSYTSLNPPFWQWNSTFWGANTSNSSPMKLRTGVSRPYSDRWAQGLSSRRRSKWSAKTQGWRAFKSFVAWDTEVVVILEHQIEEVYPVN